MEVEEIGSVTRLTGSICIRFDSLDELFIALRSTPCVCCRPPLPLRSLRCCVISGVGSGGHPLIDPISINRKIFDRI